MKKTKLKPLLLFEEFWRCGTEQEETINTSETARGNGCTRLLNEQGFMCCLGQFSMQLDETITDRHLLSNVSPDSLNKLIPDLTYADHHIDAHTNSMRRTIRNTSEVNEAIVINDDQNTTVKEKIKRLKNILSKMGYDLIFVPR